MSEWKNIKTVTRAKSLQTQRLRKSEKLIEELKKRDLDIDIQEK